MRLIDADEVLDGIESLTKSPWYHRGEGSSNPVEIAWHMGIREAVGCVRDLCIKDAPTVEPKKGQWIREYNNDYFIGYCYLCDSCKVRNEHATPYCPNCGMKMMEEGTD